MDSPFLWEPPEESGQHRHLSTTLSSSTGILNPRDVGPSGPSGLLESLDPLTMPLWPGPDESHKANSHYGMHTLYNTRPFTAPSSVSAPYYQPRYSVENAYHPAGPLFPPSSSAYAASLYAPQPIQPSSTGVRPSDITTIPNMSAVVRHPSKPSEPNRLNDDTKHAPGKISLPPLDTHLANASSSYHSLKPPMSAPAHAMSFGSTSTTDYYRPLTPLSASQVRQPRLVSSAKTKAPFSVKPSTAPVSPSRPGTSSARPTTASSSVSTALYDRGWDEIDDSQRKKRPRRRYEEIERMYACNYPGCNKGYGTLNHLNAHVTTQKHGPKRLPREFKELRKAWRERKRIEAQKKEQGEDGGDLEEDAAESDEAGRDERMDDRDSLTPTPPNGLQSVPQQQYLPAASIHQSASADRVFAFQPPALNVATQSAPYAPFNAPSRRLQNGLAPLAFPQPLRPQTAPSETYTFLNLSPEVDHEPPPDLVASYGAASSAFMSKNAFRRSSLPTTSYLPTLQESLSEAAFNDATGLTF